MSDLNLPKELKKLWESVLDSNEFSGKNKLLIDFSESLLIYVCSYIVGEYRTIDESVDYEKLFVKNNRNLSTGTYQCFLREGLKILNKAAAELEIGNILNGKNQLSKVSEFILGFEAVKKLIDSDQGGDCNEVILEKIKSRNGNYGKTNVLSFFDNFIQLRNRTAHPHKEVKGKMIHWPSDIDYYKAVNDILFDALQEILLALEPLWKFKSGTIFAEEDQVQIFSKDNLPLEYSGIVAYKDGTNVLIDNTNKVICNTLKETMKVGQHILDLIEQEKRDSLKVQNIEELKNQIELALDDGQISSDELNFFQMLCQNKLDIDNEELENIIYEVAEKLDIEDPFPEVDNRFVEAIDKALSSGEMNLFFLKLLGQNYGVDAQKFDVILKERAEALEINLEEFVANENISLTQDQLIQSIQIVNSIKWIEALYAIKMSGVSGVYTVNSGNHLTYGKKEYFHRMAFENATTYVESILLDLQEKMGSDKQWEFSANNWQIGAMTGYVWVKAFPHSKYLSSELGLCMQIYNDSYGIGFMPDYKLLERYDKLKFGLLKNLFITKLKAKIEACKDEFIANKDLMIPEIFGQGVFKPFGDVIQAMPNFLDHFYNLSHILFYKLFSDLEDNPVTIKDHLELSYSLFGSLVEDVIETYNVLQHDFQSNLERHHSVLLAICENLSEEFTKNSNCTPKLLDHVNSGSIQVSLTEKVGGTNINFIIGFFEDMKGHLNFGFKVMSSQNENNDKLKLITELVDSYTASIERLEDTCSASGLYSTQLRVTDANFDLLSDKIETCTQFSIQHINGLFNKAIAMNCPDFLSVKVNNDLFFNNKEKIDALLDELAKEELSSYKSKPWRKILDRYSYSDYIGTGKKYGWHSLSYGFSFDPEDIQLYFRIQINDRAKGFELIKMVDSFTKLDPDFITDSDPLKPMDAIWFVETCDPSSIISSSVYSKNYQRHFAKLTDEFNDLCWAAKKNDEDQWIGLMFDSIKSVSSIKIRGRKDSDQRVSKFCIAHSMDGKKWTMESSEIYEANQDNEQVKEINLTKNIICKYFRIHPTEWNKHISMSFDVLCSDFDDSLVFYEKKISIGQNIDDNHTAIKGEIVSNVENILKNIEGAFI